MWIPIVAMLSTSASLAGSKDARQAEAVRLHEEMQRLSQRTAWSGVERQYQKLVDLKGVQVPAHAHMLGARAAQATGNIAGARKRAEQAIETAGTDIDTLTAASEFLTEFDILNGPVRIDVPSQLATPPPIRSATPAFDPGLRAALAHANEEMARDRGFSGYLPLGQYLAGNTSFDVLPSTKPIRVIATPAVAVAPAPAPPVVPAGPEARMVFLSVRGEGWTADTWPTLLPDALDALRAVPGVSLVDAFAPDDTWLVVRPSSEAMAKSRITDEQLTTALGEGWLATTLDTPAEDGTSSPTPVWALPPPSSLEPATVGERPVGDVTLADLVTIEAVPNGPFPVPADSGTTARYRIEVKYAGDDPEALQQALEAVEGLQPLGFTLEEPPAR